MPADRRPSPIAGRGLFATGAYLPGQQVATLEHDVEGVDDLGLLNHSCDPSLGWTDARTLVALRDVAIGDEETVDYATCLDDPEFVLMCHCETYRCRQVIEGTDWQIPQLQQRYAGFFAPKLARRIDAASAQRPR